MYAASPNPICADADCYGSNALARFDRNPTTGAITYRGCTTGDTRSGPSGSGACREIPSASADGSSSGLNGLQSLAVSADGKSLYGTATRDSAIATFDRDPQTGALTYRGCITGDKRSGPSGSGACTQIPTATADGAGSGLNGCCGSPFSGRPSPYPVLVSPDGTSVYVGADGLAQFDRDPATGRLTYVGCIAGEDTKVAGKACKQIPGRISDERLVMSPDGRFVYAAGYGSGIAELRRNSKTGALVYIGMAKDKGDSLAIGDNGRALYTGSYSDRRVSWYSVNPKTGRPHYTGCLTGNKNEKSCTPIRTAAGGGYNSGLEKVGASAASGRMLYAFSTSSGADSDIAHFAVAPQTQIGKAKTQGHRATFKFHADAKSKFECKLKGKHVDGKLGHWQKCGSHGLKPKGKQTYRHLRPGKKIFCVRATDRSKTTDPTPAKKRWHVR
jgi:6-phosphogluconolactonase (cycloisomerase 2 family)